MKNFTGTQLIDTTSEEKYTNSLIVFSHRFLHSDSASMLIIKMEILRRTCNEYIIPAEHGVHTKIGLSKFTYIHILYFFLIFTYSFPFCLFTILIVTFKNNKVEEMHPKYIFIFNNASNFVNSKNLFLYYIFMKQLLYFTIF
jgi:hypothetical protein